MKFRVYESSEPKSKIVIEACAKYGLVIPHKKVDVLSEDDSVLYTTDVLNSDFGEYFFVRNPRNNYKSFRGCVKDAIECIREGNGDFLWESLSPYYTSSNYVGCYLDRDYGEKVRASTIERYKDAKFKYALEYGDPCSVGYALNTYLTNFTGFNDKLLTFDSKQEALYKADEIIRVGVEWAKKYRVLKADYQRNDLLAEFEMKYDSIIFGQPAINVYYNALFYALKEDFDMSTMCDYIRVVQVVDKDRSRS